MSVRVWCSIPCVCVSKQIPSQAGRLSGSLGADTDESTSKLGCKEGGKGEWECQGVGVGVAR